MREFRLLLTNVSMAAEGTSWTVQAKSPARARELALSILARLPPDASLQVWEGPVHLDTLCRPTESGLRFQPGNRPPRVAEQ